VTASGTALFILAVVLAAVPLAIVINRVDRWLKFRKIIRAMESASARCAASTQRGNVSALSQWRRERTYDNGSDAA
jgi:hypothetical protein